MMNPDYITKREIVERITIICPVAERGAVNDWLETTNYRVVRSGPYTDKEMFPKVDPSRYLFIAERLDQ